MKVLVTGGSGLLGKNISKVRSDWFYPDSKTVDITKAMTIERYLIDKQFGVNDLIFHGAAFTGIKPCETLKLKARQVNVGGTENIVNAAFKRNCHIIYISTDYVFLGKSGNYKEGDRTDPTTYYGLTKLEPEKSVLGYGKSTVIRTSFINNDRWPHDAAFEDKFSSFVTVDKIVKALVKIIEDEYRPLGLLHVGGERKSFYEMAVKMSPDVGKIKLSDTELDIPVDTSLDVTRFERIYGKIEE